MELCQLGTSPVDTPADEEDEVEEVSAAEVDEGIGILILDELEICCRDCQFHWVNLLWEYAVDE